MKRNSEASPGFDWFLYRLGDGNNGNYPRAMVRISRAQCPYRMLEALVINQYIPGRATRRHIQREIQTDGEPKYGVSAWVHDGPKGEQALGAAWLTAELEPASPDDYPGLDQLIEPARFLDRGARRILKGP